LRLLRLRGIYFGLITFALPLLLMRLPGLTSGLSDAARLPDLHFTRAIPIFPRIRREERMFAPKCVVVVAAVGTLALASPTAAQSNRPSGASHGVSLYWDSVWGGHTYRDVDGANNGSGFVVGVVDEVPHQALVWYFRRTGPFWMREPMYYVDVSVAGNTNETLAAGGVALYRPGQSVIMRYGSNPLNRTALNVGGDENDFFVASDPDANRIEVSNGTVSAHITSVTRDGVTNWSYVAFWFPTELRFGKVTLDRAGNAIAGGLAFRDTEFFGRNIRPGPFLFKVDPSGEVLWLRDVMPGDITSVRTADDGTIVLVIVARGPFTWAGQSYEPRRDAPEFLLAAGPDGSELWARQLDNSNTPFLMRVNHAGQIATAGGNTGCSGMLVRNFDSTGNLLWERVFDPQSCDGRVQAMGLTFSDDDVVVTGDMQGTVDLGFGPYFFSQQTPFYLGLSM
jgi:hypothetical protein